MKARKIWVPVAAALLIAGPAIAQNAEQEEVRRAVEATAVRDAERSERLRAAEAQMAAAAREIAELTSDRLPMVVEFQKRLGSPDRPRIGITIDGSDDSGPVEGVAVIGVTPGSAADDAGLRTGDVITSVNGESMTAEHSMAANKLLFDFMDGVEEGDELEIEYLRNGNQGTVELSPRIMEAHAFTWSPGVDRDVFVKRFKEVAPAMGVAQRYAFGFPWAGSSWGSMELIELSEGLGKYFGTDKGLLVVKAPSPDAMGLEDGDVIQSIDGREPKNVRHVLKILGTYEPGESFEIGIMRDKRKRKLEVELPEDDRQSRFREFRRWTPEPARPPAAPPPPAGNSST